MSNIWQILFVLVLLTSCKTKTVTNDKSIELQKCPMDGSCSFEVFKDTELLILEDEFKNSYHRLQAAKGRVVLKFEYKRNQDPDLADDSYSEMIFIEIDEEVTDLELNNELLSKAKVSFRRMCFCRGATGLYKIRKGRLHISDHRKGFQVTLYFEIDEVPQVISSFTEYFEI
ncbi:hypothetical protein F0365_10990 [Nonlabens sp. Ci31]|uniref:hypothetical protein n=1 Tax=Nonlabens sp. Ci31 TaxID=2608253 RepID=UPI001462C44C|nr:hypothetical protein [Nonlabens sp. Ci31]QJP34876.1 hypothetical protein F0365_10990 [Nonlabens sp. Ci31]